MSAKQTIKSLRDHPAVLAGLVGGLHCLRLLPPFRGESLYQHVPYRGVVRLQVPGGGQFSVIAKGGQIENRLYWDGIFGHEPASMQRWLAVASKARVVIDIGANSGIFGLAAAAAGAQRVHAFEPIARIHQIVQDNIKASGLAQITAWHCAVGDSTGYAEIVDPGGDAPTSATLSRSFAQRHLGSTEAVKVKVVTLDDWAHEHAVSQIDLIKIDVEGFEVEALRGMANVIRANRPAILIEVLDDYEQGIRDTIQELFGDMYTWERIVEGGDEPNRNVLLQSR